jgi:hypothetical protein
MKSGFDELTKSMAQSVTRRGALKKFGVGLAGLAVAAFGLANKGQAQTTCLPNGYECSNNNDCCSGNCQSSFVPGPGKKQKYKVRLCAA